MININEYFAKREQGNISNITIISKPIIPLRMLQLEAITEYYFREPEYIYIQKRSELIYEIVFQCVFYYPNCKEVSWSIYADDRKDKNIENIIVRHSIWNKNNDMQKIKENFKQNREKIAMLPDIKTYTHVCNFDETKYVASILSRLDSVFSNGIVLEDNFNEIEPWSDVEIQRRLSWGTVRAIWNQDKRWKNMSQIITFLSELERMINYSEFVINDSSELDFMFPIDEYVKNIYPYAENIENK